MPRGYKKAHFSPQAASASSISIPSVSSQEIYWTSLQSPSFHKTDRVRDHTATMSEAFILRRNNIRATGVQEDHLTVIGFFRRFCQNEIPDELSQACSNYGMFTRMYKFHYADRRRGCKFNELLLWGHVRTVLVICLESKGHLFDSCCRRFMLIHSHVLSHSHYRWKS